MTGELEIERLSPADVISATPELAAILLECVTENAVVGFVAGLSQSAAEAYWRSMAESVRRDGRAVLVARDGAGIVGTVQVVAAPAQNQPHRADIEKMMVASRARRQGVGAFLLRYAEGQAVAMERSLGVLGAVVGDDGERLYLKGGWTRAGVIPDYGVRPNGDLFANALFFKILA